MYKYSYRKKSFSIEKKWDIHICIHYNMSICGGFLGAYALLGRMDIFGSSQTVNLIDAIFEILGKNWEEAVLHIGAFLVFSGSIVLSVLLTRKTSLNLKYIAIFIETAVVIIEGALPDSMNALIALYPIFFVSAFQWSVFKGAKGYESSTIFSTNNVKQTMIALTEYFICREKKEERKKYAEKAKFFGGTLISYYAGVSIEYISWKLIGMHSIWVCVVPLIVCLNFLIVSDVK